MSATRTEMAALVAVTVYVVYAEAALSPAARAFLEAVEALPEDVDAENLSEVLALLDACQAAYEALTEDDLAFAEVADAALRLSALAEAASTLEIADAVEVSSYQELSAAVAKAGSEPVTIIVTESFDLTGYLQIKQEQTVTLTAREGVVLGRSEAAKGCLWVNGTLNLKDVVLDGRNIPCGYAMVHIVDTGTVTMAENSAVQNAHNNYSAKQYGGGVYNAGTFVLNGGTITGNTADSYGGGVYNKGAFTMNDGEISNNLNGTWYGGGVYNKGTFTANGGRICGNQATNSTFGYGGGVYSSTGINMKDTEVSGNVNGGVEVGGAALSASTGKYTLDNVAFTGNTGNRPALLINSLASWDITNCGISGNRNTNGAAAELKMAGMTLSQVEEAMKSVRTLDGCVISGNTSSSYNGAALSLSSGEGVTNVTNCAITGNSGVNGGVYCAGDDVTTLGPGTRIEGNTGTTTGGVHNQRSSNGDGALVIGGAVVTGNSGNSTDGVYTSGSRLDFVSGAVYGNGSGKDFRAGGRVMVYSLIKASEMSDAGTDFAAQEYSWMGAPAGKENEALENAGEVTLTASPNIERVYARIGGTEYLSLEAAIEAAKEGDVVDFVLGEDGFGSKLTVSEPIPISKNISIRFSETQGQSILANGGELFQIAEGVTLALRGAAMMDGKIILNGGSLEMDGGIKAYAWSTGQVVKKDLTVDVQNGTFTINGTVTPDQYSNSLKVVLAKGQFITAGEGFGMEARANIKVTLDSETYDKFNSAGSETALEGCVLISGCADQSLPPVIEFTKPFTSSFVQVKADSESGSIVLFKNVLAGGVYLDGGKGKDENSGLTSDAPVKTFEKAMEIANKEGDIKTIYVCGEVPASTEIDGMLESGEPVTLMRYLAYKGHLIKASSGASLKNIILDGASGMGVKDGKSLIYVTGGTVTLGEGAVLQNNDVSGHAQYPWHYGGGVYVGGSAEFVMEDGAKIQNCTARVGGAVLANGTFTMNGGEIVYNKAVLTNSGHMVMNGGLIDSNYAAAAGGGISLPFTESNDLVVVGGTISNNEAESSGGGIYIQCTNKATVGSENGSGMVYITGNKAHGKSVNGLNNSQYAGGGIYVNGSKDGYDNGVLQLYNVVVTKNAADWNGNGLAACPTGQLDIYLTNGGAFYGNNGATHDDVYFVGDAGGGIVGAPSTMFYKFFLSPFMLGGGASNWKYLDGSSCDLAALESYGAGMSQFYSDCNDEAIKAAENAACVFIEENTSDSNGGGIGTNGKVIIGTKHDFTEITIKVSKLWNDEGLEDHRPDFIDVIIWRTVQSAAMQMSMLRNAASQKMAMSMLRNDPAQTQEVDSSYEEVGTLRISKNENGEWPVVSYNHLPQEDSNGNPYVYGIKEVVYGEYSYSAEIVKDSNGENSFVITNTPAGKLTITKALAGTGSGAAAGNTFTFRVSCPENSYEETVKITGAGSATLEGLNPGKYTVTEDASGTQVSGYTWAVSGSGVEAEVKSHETSSVTITNTYEPQPDTKVGSLIITKVVNGGGSEAQSKTYSFTVTGPNGYSAPVTITGPGSARLDGLAVGEYTVTEDREGAVIGGYTLTVTEDGTPASVTENGTANVTNTYTPPDNPGPGPGPGPGPDPTPPRTPQLPDPNDPESPEEVTVVEEDVPRTYVKTWDPEEEEYVYVPEEDVPLADVTPETGDSSETARWAFLCLMSAAGLAVLRSVEPRKKEEAE